MINSELKVLDSQHRSQGLLEINSAGKAIDREINESVYHEKLHASGNSEICLKKTSVSNQKFSQKSLALETLRDNGITLVPEMKCFVVKGSHNNKHAVTLFPKETCNYLSTSRCHHILSAMMAIGWNQVRTRRQLI